MFLETCIMNPADRFELRGATKCQINDIFCEGTNFLHLICLCDYLKSSVVHSLIKIHVKQLYLNSKARKRSIFFDILFNEQIYRTCLGLNWNLLIFLSNMLANYAMSFKISIYDFLFQFLQEVASHHQSNRMDTSNLSIVWTPNLMPFKTGQVDDKHVINKRLSIVQVRSH